MLRSFIDNVASVATSGTAANTVSEINANSLNHVQKIDHDGYMFLTKERLTYQGVLYNPDSCKKAFSLFRMTTEKNARTMFADAKDRIGPIFSSSYSIYNDTEKLKDVWETFCNKKAWTSAHIAAHCSVPESFQNPAVLIHVMDQDQELRQTPLHLAVASNRLEVVKELLQQLESAQVRNDIADRDGNTAVHLAAQSSSSNIMELLLRKQRSAIDLLNLSGESALHICCKFGNVESAKLLLENGADMTLTGTAGFPIHYAVENAQNEIIDLLYERNSNVIDIPDSVEGGTPLHWAQTKKTVDKLINLGANINKTNRKQESVLLTYIRNNWLDSLMELFLHNADPNKAGGEDGNTPLHIAVESDNVDLVRTLIVFGADVNICNKSGISPRHLAASGKGTNRDTILYTLHAVGAERCPKLSDKGCKDGCSFNGTNNGKLPGKNDAQISDDIHKEIYDEMISAEAVSAAISRSSSGENTDKVPDASAIRGAKVLCLDGGGIRGLVLVQVLLAIEKAANKPISELFDWIAGTSTGGMLALAIVYGGKSCPEKHARVNMMRSVYFRMKDDVFQGKRPYDEAPLENLLKGEFGETKLMTAVSEPKVMVTAALVDRTPPALHLFRNYAPPSVSFSTEISPTKGPPVTKFKPPPPPDEQQIWRAARSTGAAPTYFRAVNRFLDGGIISNNPTLDAMTEIHEYNMSLKAKGLDDQIVSLGLVVSLGTGRNPVEEIKSVDVFRPTGVISLLDAIGGAQSLAKLIIEQATSSEGRVVSRARAWCSMIHVPYFRLSPALSEPVPLDVQDDSMLLKMLWETEVFLFENRDKIQQLGALLAST